MEPHNNIHPRSMLRSTKEKMFDIKAPLARQQTRDGRKVLSIFDSGLDVRFPIVAWISGPGSPNSFVFTRNGYGCYGDTQNALDIITLPEAALFQSFWVNIYPYGLKSIVSSSYARASEIRTYEAIATIKITYDPNTGESSAETVWVRP